jgi:hypothetical protein
VPKFQIIVIIVTGYYQTSRGVSLSNEIGRYATPASKVQVSAQSLNPNKLYFPYQLVEEVGLCRRSIAFLKKKGCRFFGRKTKLVWINEFLEEQAKALSPA